MKKKSIIILVPLIITVVCLSCYIILQSDCKDHVWSEYKYNEYVHWREYTCGCDWPEIVEEHQDSNTDGLCDICNHSVHLHESADTFYYNNATHWEAYLCECKESKIQESHIDENKDAKCDVCEYVLNCEHVWSDEPKWGYIGSLPNTPKYVTCQTCSEVKVIDSEGTGEEYQITFKDGAEKYVINNVPEKAAAGSIITIRIPLLVGENDYLNVMANDLTCLFFAQDEITRTISFIMPPKDVVISITMMISLIEYYDPYYAYLSYTLTWLNDITADDVKEIQMAHHIMNVSVGSYDEVYSLFDKESIADLLYQFKWMPMYDIAGFSPAPSAPKLFFDFVLNDGTVYSFYIYCGFLNGHWALKYIPDITKYQSVDHAYTFVVYFSYAHVVDLSLSQQVCCLNDVDEWEFVLIDEDNFPTGDPTHSIKINYTTLYVVDGEYFYYFNNDEEKIYCRLTERNFYEMIDGNSEIYSSLIEAFLEKNPTISTATVFRYYGTSETGAIMGRIVSPEIEYEDYTGRYGPTPISHANQIFVLYENELYSLSTAYKNGYITYDDIKTIYQNP